jgi:predicted nucleic acid-binding protein
VIVDTNALSAFADGSSLAIAALEAAGEVSVPVIVLGEFRYGITHSRRHREYEAWLEQYLPAFRVLEVTPETALEYARLRSELRHFGKPIPANDVWIAALCRQHDLPLLSRDAHFDHVKRLRRQAW